jgi:hypothetical protein
MTKRSMANLSPRFLRLGFAWRNAGRIAGTNQRRFLLFAGPGIDASTTPADPGFICVIVDQKERQLFVDGGFTTFAEAWLRANKIVTDIEQERIK